MTQTRRPRDETCHPHRFIGEPVRATRPAPTSHMTGTDDIENEDAIGALLVAYEYAENETAKSRIAQALDLLLPMGFAEEPN